MISDTPTGNPDPQRCPVCGADIGNGDLHWPGCRLANLSTPADADIDFETIRASDAPERADEACPHEGCDRCKVQTSTRGGCYHKNEQGCAIKANC